MQGVQGVMTDQFGRTAVKLSQGPLGIIALFIVLIYGIAGLVSGFATDIGETNRSVLILFLVLFPVGVLVVFTWLVAFHHTKLYPPQAFRDESHFAALATFGGARFDKPALQTNPPKESAAPPGSLKPSATGSLYWLGHDLMWTADALLRQAPSERVLVGLDQAQHHLAQVGLGETQIAREILDLRELIKQSQELSPPVRDAYASQLGSIIDRIGMTAEAAQLRFEKPPHWNRVRS
jgi:hypothetical protein